MYLTVHSKNIHSRVLSKAKSDLLTMETWSNKLFIIRFFMKKYFFFGLFIVFGAMYVKYNGVSKYYRLF